jgi:acyl-CoA synthetase (AMP-forming)/AMP-acid ligase II
MNDNPNDDAARLHPAAHAASDPDRVALVMSGSGETRTYRELDEASTRLALVLRDRGMRPGDHLAVLLDNEVVFFEAVWAGLRAGLYVTPINWHLTADEAGYIVADSGATALVTSAHLGDTVHELGDDLAAVTTRLAVGGQLEGFEPYEEVVPGRELDAVSEECEGSWMFYSSGTTGRPKGIVPPAIGGRLGAPSPFTTLLTGLFGFTDETVYLSPAPLYHAAPAGWTTMTQRLGGTAVVMERFDPVEFLAQIERHRVTHTQVVPTHLVRLLKLPERERTRFDLKRSLRLLVHAAAPCPVEVKRAALDWLGPIIHEFYSGSEGSGFCYIGPDDWLAHPGSVGRSLLGGVHILGDGGEELPAGEAGQVWFETPHRFEYHRDPEKTAAAWNDRGWSTLWRSCRASPPVSSSSACWCERSAAPGVVPAFGTNGIRRFGTQVRRATQGNRPRAAMAAATRSTATTWAAVRMPTPNVCARAHTAVNAASMRCRRRSATTCSSHG